MSRLPILYSFRRCPYAMRARLTLVYDGTQQVILREVSLKNKPSQMLELSPKGTVPVLHLPDGEVIDESLDIMRWVCGSDHHLFEHSPDDQETLIARNDGEFKQALDRYKYHVRYPEHDRETYRDQALAFIDTLEALLTPDPCLFGPEPQFADLAIVPFVRQFAMVDQQWFFSHPDYPRTRTWLEQWLASPRFKTTMTRYTPWDCGDPSTLFPDV